MSSCTQLLFILLNFTFLFKSTLADNINLEIEFEWRYLNFSWPSPQAYAAAIQNNHYMAANVTLSASKAYKNRLYFCLATLRKGVPATLASISLNSTATSPLLDPYPNWSFSDPYSSDCSGLKNVQSFEIDQHGTMWVIDGNRDSPTTGNCPAKIVLLDLNNGGNVILSYSFSDEVALNPGGFLNDIVVDPSDGGYAYITDVSVIDPGLIVFSRKQKKSWKYRDVSMFAVTKEATLKIGDETYNFLAPIDGIALSSQNSNSGNRTVLYCPLSSLHIFGIPNYVLKNFQLYQNGSWRSYITDYGKKQDLTDGMVADANGNLYYTLITLNGIGKWKIGSNLKHESSVVFKNKNAVGPDSLSIDADSNLRLVSDNFQRFGIYKEPLNISENYLIRVWKAYIGTKSYLYG